jgi:hypothetical protein
MERRKSVYVKFIETFWIWQDVYGINDSRWSQALASHWQTLLHNVVYSTPRHERDSNSLVVIDTDCSAKLAICFWYIMVRTRYILMRWWCLICTRPTHLFGSSLHNVIHAYHH